jgi:hypothetical protein
MSVDPNRPQSNGPLPPEWGSGPVMSLFQTVAQLQIEADIFDTWKDWRLSGITTTSGQFMPAPNLPDILRDTYSELPLAVTKQKLQHGEGHDDYLLGLAKINPATGELIPDTWTYAAELEDGKINDKHSPYNADQLALIHWQVQAQELLGIVLQPGSEQQ